MMQILTSKQMKEADRYTIDVRGIPGRELMYRAAECTAEEIRKRMTPPAAVLVVCGSGNNGGDGFAAAAILQDMGYRVSLVCMGNPDNMSSEAREMKEMTVIREIPIYSNIPDSSVDVCVDALFGIGLSRDLTGEYAAMVNAMNTLSAYRVAVDIASGISADTGAVLGTAFHADLTVTFAYRKLGQVLYPGREYTGECVVRDIGIQGDPEESSRYMRAYDPQSAAQHLPVRKAYSNKGTYGRLLIAAGSPGMAGAAFFSALAAYRCGTGLVRIVTAEENRIPLQTLLPEAILTCYTDTTDALRKLEHCVDWATAIVCGPGLGMEQTGAAITEWILSRRKVPMLLDADALNLLARHRYPLQPERGPLILTPHLKEMSRLCGRPVSDIRLNLVECAREYAAEQRVICVLKDAVSVIAGSTEGTAWLNVSGSSAMAKGGSGDVLTGVIGSMLCQGCTPEVAASLGTYLHGLAGEHMAGEKGEYAGLARELADALGPVMQKLILDE